MKTFRGLATFLIPCASMFCALPASAATLFTNPSIPASEKQGMQLIYQLNIPNINPGWKDANKVPYATPNNVANFANAFATLPNRRVGYYLEVGTEYVYVSMDAFTTNLASIGYPHNVDNPVARQNIVGNANVYSNNSTITNVTGSSTVNLEMAPSNYGPEIPNAIRGGSNSAFDYDDSGFSTGAGHGSFQIHNYGLKQVLFGHSDWGGNNNTEPSELGIGTRSGGEPDWTFSNTGATGFLQIFALVPEPSRGMLLLGGAMLMGLRRRRTA